MNIETITLNDVLINLISLIIYGDPPNKINENNKKLNAKSFDLSLDPNNTDIQTAAFNDTVAVILGSYDCDTEN